MGELREPAMADATAARPEIDPDRASFTTALHAARDLVIQAAGVIADTVIDLAGTIGRHVPNVDRTSYQATISVAIHAPPEP